jgi:mannitol 2-dehydrogenase
MTEEAMPTLHPVPGVDLVQYREQLIERFSSEAISDTLARQVVDGSQRIPKFLLPVLRAQLEADGPIERIALVVAAWSRYLEGSDEQGRAVTPVDDRADLIVPAAKREATDPGAFLRLKQVFGDLGGNARFMTAFLAAREQLIEHGARAAVARLGMGSPA